MPKQKKSDDPPPLLLSGKRQRRPPKSQSEYLVGDELDQEINSAVIDPKVAPAAPKPTSTATEIYIVAEQMGEGALHAFSSRAAAEAVADSLLYDGGKGGQGTGTALARPFRVVGSATLPGDNVYVTLAADSGAVYYIGGAYKTRESAEACSGQSHMPPGATDGELEVVELVLA